MCLIRLDKIDCLYYLNSRKRDLEREYKKTKDFKILYEINTIKAILRKEIKTLEEDTNGKTESRED